jgi:hypothetical protein
MRKTVHVLAALVCLSAGAAEPIVTPALEISPVRASATTGSRHPASLAGSPYGFLALWTDVIAPSSGLLYGRFNLQGELLDRGGIPPVLEGWSIYGGPAVWRGNEYVLLVHGQKHDTGELAAFTFRVLLDGSLAGPPERLPRELAYMAVNDRGEVLVAPGLGGEARFLDANGALNENRTLAIPASLGNVDQIAAQGEDWLFLTTSSPAFGASLNETRLTRFHDDAVAGSVKVISTPGYTYPRLAVHDEDILVLWIESVTGSVGPVTKVKYTQIDRRGFVPAPVVLQESGAETVAAASWDGETFLMAWVSRSTSGAPYELRVATTAAKGRDLRAILRDRWPDELMMARGARTMMLNTRSVGDSGGHEQIEARVFDTAATLDASTEAVPVAGPGVPVQTRLITAAGPTGTFAVWHEWDGTDRTVARFYPRQGHAAPAFAIVDGVELQHDVAAVADGFVLVQRRYLPAGSITVRLVAYRFDAQGKLIDSLVLPPPGDGLEIMPFTLEGGERDALVGWSESAKGFRAVRLTLDGAAPEAVVVLPETEVVASVQFVRTSSGDYLVSQEGDRTMVWKSLYLTPVPHPGQPPAGRQLLWLRTQALDFQAASNGTEVLLVMRPVAPNACVEVARFTPGNVIPPGHQPLTVDCVKSIAPVSVAWAGGSWWLSLDSVPSPNERDAIVVELENEPLAPVRTFRFEREMDEREIELRLLPAPGGLLLSSVRTEPTAGMVSRGFFRHIVLTRRSRAVR